ncbi:hypothetical protein OG897_29320 [Streptomyces sp. NBC_00237]|nr:sigma factor-like helix-turn-helix DNA-binding protein [Streptomyces sp. NBC_00237]MCX5205548.1 hypothetical protein [Streptomyces sp. NBC_00237]
MLYQRYFADMTQANTATEVGLSQMHVSRIITGACSRIRAQVLAERPGA